VSQQVLNKSLSLSTLFIIIIITTIIIMSVEKRARSANCRALTASRIQGNSAVLLRNLSLNSGNDISPGEGFAVSEFALGHLIRLSLMVSRKKRGSTGMARPGLSSEQTKKQKFLIFLKFFLQTYCFQKSKNPTNLAFHHFILLELLVTAKILNRTTEVYFVHFLNISLRWST
jgi:hypothetical protein